MAGWAGFEETPSMRLPVAALAVLTGAGIGLAAPAAYAAASPEDVIAVFGKTGGFSEVKVVEKPGDTAALTGKLGQVAFVMQMTGCTNGKACDLIVMQAKFSLDRPIKPTDFEGASGYNASHPYTSAFVWVGEDGNAEMAISYGVVLSGGVTFQPANAATFGGTLELYRKYVSGLLRGH
jgi:hypothetical protein